MPCFLYMERSIITTADGSHTLFVPSLNEHFHSVHGAIQESVHVYINNGLRRCDLNPVVVFEVGFGTGLNALLSLIYRGNRKVTYYSIEQFPLNEQEFLALNFAKQISPRWEAAFSAMHRAPWNQLVEIEEDFKLYKIKNDLIEFEPHGYPPFDLIYFDAFGPEKQPEMWDEAIFEKLSAQTKPGGVFVTYCAKGEVRRRLIRTGFDMKRIPGPPGKKEMLFGQKIK